MTRIASVCKGQPINNIDDGRSTRAPRSCRKLTPLYSTPGEEEKEESEQINTRLDRSVYLADDGMINSDES